MQARRSNGEPRDDLNRAVNSKGRKCERAQSPQNLCKRDFVRIAADHAICCEVSLSVAVTEGLPLPSCSCCSPELSKR